MAGSRLEGVRVAVLAADGFEQVELTIPSKRLRNEGAEVRVVSLRPGRIRGMNLLWPGKKVRVQETLFTARAHDFDALLLPGGYINPDFLRQSDEALEFVREFDRAGKPIAVICHGPWVLISAGLVRGRKLASWPGIADDVRNAGGIWRDEAAVRESNWVSSRSPLDIPAFNDAMVSLFADQATRSAARQRTRMSWGLRAAAVAALVAVTFTTARRLSA